jgi:hypothetical protein
MTTLASEAAHTDLEEGQHELVKLDHKGDTRIIWDPQRPAEVDVARQTFDRLVKDERYSAFAVDRRGEKGEHVREFDPDAEKLILTPPLVGG